MRSTRLLAIAALAAALPTSAISCGGGGREPASDAAVPLVGLGQPCDPAVPSCPANAPGCLTPDGSPSGICSNICVMGATAMTNAQGGFVDLSPDPAAVEQQSKCTAIFAGSVGAAVCGTFIFGGELSWDPPENPPLANKAYTNINVACAIACAADGACPGGLSCNNANRTCVP